MSFCGLIGIGKNSFSSSLTKGIQEIMNTNNKKFRKSTIVIPALALMVLTAGASATGAVAWFKATREVSATASTFTAASLTSALTITAKKGQGTEVVTKTVDQKSVATPDISLGTNYLCDASYDASDTQGDTIGKLYRSVLDPNNGSVTAFAVVPANGYDTTKVTNDGQHHIFYAVDWTYTFTYSTTNPDGSALLFDLSSTFDKNENVAAGFRIAFNNNDKTTYRVWANDEIYSYVNGTSSASTSTYPSTNIVQGDTTRVEDSSATATAAVNLPGYLGKFTSGDNAVTSIEIKCTAWYEGTDEAAVNNTKLAAGNPAIKASMKFYVRDLKRDLKKASV